MIGVPDDAENPSFWQAIFLQSKVNGAPCRGDQLPRHHREWPKNTYLQCRLRYVRESQTFQGKASDPSPEAPYEILYKDLL